MSYTTVDILADVLRRLSKEKSRIKITDEEAAEATQCYNGLIGDLKKYQDKYNEVKEDIAPIQSSRKETKSTSMPESDIESERALKVEEENKNLKTEIKRKDEEIARLQKRLGPTSSAVASDKYREMQQLLQQKERTIQELRTRLSGIAGQKLSEGNPEITDLSDPYRPTILAQNFSQIYDNEWTAAFEDLQCIRHFHDKDNDIVDVLSFILRAVNKFCIEAERDQFEYLKTSALREILQPTIKDQRASQSSSTTAEMSTMEENAAKRHLMELRKALAVLSSQGYLKIFAGLHTKAIIQKTKITKIPDGINTFIESSLKSIWLMKVQDPPVVLKWVDPGTKVETDKFSFYTKKGKTVAQCVWPAVLLHEGGPLMSKGIVQGRGD